MQISVTGRQIDVGDGLRQRIEANLADSVEKYFDHAIEGNIVFSREAHGIRADISGRGILVQGHGHAGKAHAAFDSALERIAKRLRRHKRRLRDHHRDRKGEGLDDTLRAQQYILSGEGEGEGEDGGESEGEDGGDDRADGGGVAPPVVIAEMTTRIDSLTVGEAVMRMDLADQPALMFRNIAHGGLNVVYRRTDGNIGWIDPEGNPTANAGRGA